jgi:WD40 repeat protein
MVVKWDLHDMDKGELVAKVPNSVYAIHYLPDTDFLVVGHNYEGIHLIDWKRKKEVASLKCTTGAIFDIKSLGTQLFIGDSGGNLTVVDLKEWKVQHTVRLSEKSLRTIAVNAQRGELALGFSDHIIRILSLNQLDLRKELTNHSNSVFTLTYDPNRDLLFSAGRDAHLLVWDAARDHDVKDDIIAHMYAINDITFSADGKHFVTCSMDKSIKVWDANSISLLKVIDKARHAGHGTSVNRTLWLQDALISASDDRTISAWSLEFN